MSRFRMPLSILLLMAACLPRLALGQADEGAAAAPRKPVVKSDAEWRKLLTRDQYYVTRMKGTEPAWTSPYVSDHRAGVFHCVGCGSPLFSSRTKFDSGTGWPSFYQPIARGAIVTEADFSTGEQRVEVECAVCHAHLGHVFADGPPPTGLRYCMNGVALKLIPTKATAKAASKPAARKPAVAK